MGVVFGVQYIRKKMGILIFAPSYNLPTFKEEGHNGQLWMCIYICTPHQTHFRFVLCLPRPKPSPLLTLYLHAQRSSSSSDKGIPSPTASFLGCALIKVGFLFLHLLFCLNKKHRVRDERKSWCQMIGS